MKYENGDRPSTLSDLKALETRIDGKVDYVKTSLEKTIHIIAKGVVDLQTEVRKIKETMATKADIDQILSFRDYATGKIKDQDNTVVAFDHILKMHNERIKRLEDQFSSLSR